MTPFATWRSRLPASIGSWFSRDLVRVALTLVEAKRVVLRAVEDLKIESVKPHEVAKEIAALLEMSAAEAGVTLEVRGNPELTLNAPTPPSSSLTRSSSTDVVGLPMRV